MQKDLFLQTVQENIIIVSGEKFNVWAEDDMILSAGNKAQFNSSSGTQIDSGETINIMAGTTSNIKSIGELTLESTGANVDIDAATRIDLN